MFTWVDGLPLHPHEGDPHKWGNTGFEIMCQDEAALRACFQYVTAARFNKASYDLARSPDCPYGSRKVSRASGASGGPRLRPLASIITNAI
jgi:hypothetical protein